MLKKKISSDDTEVPNGNFIAVHDSTYNAYVQKFQAKTALAKVF